MLITDAPGTSVTSSTIGGGVTQGNVQTGVMVVGSVGVTIGGTLGTGDDIQGNGGDGVNFDATSTGGLVAGSTISGNADYGVSFNGTSASTLSGEVVTDDLIQFNLAGGILISYAPGTTVSASSIGGISGFGNGGVGIEAFQSANVSIQGSSITGNTDAGIYVEFSPDAVLSADDVEDNTGVGIYLDQSPGGSISSSTSSGTTLASDFEGIGIVLDGSANVTIEGSIISGNAAAGIYDFGGSNALITNNQVTLNTGAAVDLESASDVTITSNTLNSTGMSPPNSGLGGGNEGDGIYAMGSTGMIATANTIEGNAGNGIELVASSNLATITSNTIGGTADGIPAGLPNGGFGILVNGSTGVTIGGAGVGNTIAGNTAGGILFEAASDNGQVLNSSIENNVGVGVTVMDSANAILTDLLLVSNAAGGVLLSNASNATLDSDANGLTLIESNGGYGVSVLGSSGVTLGGTDLSAGLLVVANSGPGIAIEDSDGASVTNSTIDNNTGDGIDVGDTMPEVTGVSLVNDGVYDNLGDGIALSAFAQATISGSTVQSNGSFGIVANGASGVTVDTSTITGNTGIGLAIINPTAAPTVTGSTIQSNLGGGIFLLGSTGGTIVSSTIGGTTSDLGNGGFGVSISGSSGVTIGDPADFLTAVESNEGVGIAATNSSGLFIEGVIVAGNGGAGITLTSSASPVIGLDFVLYNQGDGLDLFGSTGAFLGGDVVESNLGVGILLSKGSGADVSVVGLTVESNGSTGIAVTDSAIRLFAATISGNVGAGVSIVNPTNPTGSNDTNLQLVSLTIQSNLGGGVSLVNDTVGGIIGLSTIGGATGQGNQLFGLSLVNSPGVIIGGMDSANLIQGNGGVGISLASSNAVQFMGVTFVADNSADGIDVISSTGVSIQGVTILNNLGSGVTLDGSNQAILTADEIYGNFGSGVLATNSSNLVLGGAPGAGLLIFANGGAGISVASSSAVTIDSDAIQSNQGGGIALNRVSGNVTNDTVGGVSADLGNDVFGISLANSPSIILTNLMVLFNGGNGIAVSNSTGVTFNGTNLVAKNTGNGIVVSSSLSVAIQGTSVIANSGSGIVLSNGSDYAKLTADTIAENLGSGVVATNSANLVLGVVGSLGLSIYSNLGTGLSVFNSTNLTIEEDVIQANQGGGIALNSVSGEVADMLVGGVSADLGNGIFGISVANSNELRLDNLMVLFNGGNGLTATASDNLFLGGSNLIAKNSGDGIALSSLIGGTIEGTRLLANSGAGIALTNGADSVNIVADTISYNSGSGVNATDSGVLAIGGDTIVGNLGTGLIVGGANANTVIIESDTVQSNHVGGIALEGVTGGVANVTIGGVTPDLGNGIFGISVARSPGLGLANLLVLSNGGDGVIISAGSNGASLIGGQFSGNAGAGLLISGSSKVSLSSASGVLPITGNLADGIDINNSPLAMITAVGVGDNNGVGINVVASPFTTIQSVGSFGSVFENGGDGIDLSGSNQSTVAHTIVTNNKRNGIAITSAQVSVFDSIVADNDGTGIEVLGLSNSFNTISLTNVSENLGDGVLILNSPNNTVGTSGFGDTIEDNSASGVVISGLGSTSNVVNYDLMTFNALHGVAIEAGASGNYVGTFVAGSGNTITNSEGDGVAIYGGASNNVIVGDTLAANQQSGVQISGPSTGNFVLGSSLLGNGSDGVMINQAVGTVIGGIGQSNVISSNKQDGISVVNSASTPATIIQSNFIGTNSIGSTTEGNLGEGIHVDGSSGLLIGSPVAGGGNVVSQNIGGGIELANASNANTVMNNRIGTDVFGANLLGTNQAFGLFVNNSGFNNIGGTTAYTSNVIAGPNSSQDFGIQLYGPNSIGNVIAGNQIGITTYIPNSPAGFYALGDHIGIYINGAPDNVMVANRLGGSDLAEILIGGSNASGNQIGVAGYAGNVLDGGIQAYDPNSTNLAFPIGIMIVGTQGTVISSDNTIEGLTVGIEAFGTPVVPTVITGPTTTYNPQPPLPVLSTITNNLFLRDGYGVLINGSPSNLVYGNEFYENSFGVEVLGGQSQNNTILDNTFGNNGQPVIPGQKSDNLYGVYVESASFNTISGNQIHNGDMYGVVTSDQSYQAGIYLYGSLSQSNVVTNNTITNVFGYGIVFLNTPQASNQINSQTNNNVTGSHITNILTDAVEANLIRLSGIYPSPVPVITPTSSTATVKASSVKVQISSAFSGKRPISPKTSKSAKTTK